MALDILTGVPSVIEANNNYNFQETFTQYPSARFYLTFVMQIPGSSPVSVSATNGTSNSFNVALTGTNTNQAPGEYVFAEYVTEYATGQRATAKTGVVQIIPDLTQPQTLSTAAQLLAKIETAISNLTAGGMQSVSVNNVSYTRYDVSTLIAMRTRLQAEVKRENDAAQAFRGIETSGRIGTRFKPSPSGAPFFSKDIGE